METPDTAARILPFRGRQTAAAPRHAEVQLRLQQALAKLNDAMAAQSSAVAAWRGSTEDLGARATALAETAADFQQALDALAAEVARVNTAARTLAGAMS